MKTNSFLYVILLLFFTLPQLQAQMDFAPVGAEWWYSNYYCWPSPNDIYSVQSTKDTMVQGRDCRLLEYTFHDASGSQAIPEANLIVTSDSNRVYYQLRDSFHLLFDFGAPAGTVFRIEVDSHLVHWGYSTGGGGLIPSFRGFFDVMIDTVFTVNIGGEELRAYQTSFVPTYEPNEIDWYYQDMIIEKIGPVGDNSFFGVSQIINTGGGTPPGFQCYTDQDIAYQEVTPCDRLFPNTSTRDLRLAEAPLRLSPNPVSDWLELELLHDQGGRVQIYHASGKLVFDQEEMPMSTQISTTTWPAGVYLVRFEKEGQYHLQKLLKIN